MSRDFAKGLVFLLWYSDTHKKTESTVTFLIAVSMYPLESDLKNTIDLSPKCEIREIRYRIFTGVILNYIDISLSIYV